MKRPSNSFALKKPNLPGGLANKTAALMGSFRNALQRVLPFLRTRGHAESGQGMVEYVLLLALIALMVAAGTVPLASVVNNSFKTVHSRFHKHVGKHLGWSK